MRIVGKVYLILFICAALDCNRSSPAKPSSRPTTGSDLCSCGGRNDGAIVTPPSLRAGIHDASLQGSDGPRPADALEADAAGLAAEPVRLRAVAECLGPKTYADAPRYHVGLMRAGDAAGGVRSTGSESPGIHVGACPGAVRRGHSP